MSMKKLFPTYVYQSKLTRQSQLLQELIDESYKIKSIDESGQRWSVKNYPGGYTSYASMSELYNFSSSFLDIRKKIDQHVQKFAKELELDIPLKQLQMTSLWLNIMPTQVVHTMHIHPLSVLSGTFYLQTPKNCSALKFEDPRLVNFMASPPRKSKAKMENQRFISLAPEAGDLILFESWMRHEVPPNQSKQDRISVSFNYDWVR